MTNEPLTRRAFLARTSAAAAALAATAAGPEPRHLATNEYPWGTFARRAGRKWSRPAGLPRVAAAGFDGFEPGLNGPADARPLLPLLKKHRLAMRSAYMNVLLHDPKKADNAIKNAVATFKVCRDAGTAIGVVNPTPVRWGGPENKSDEQLAFQAQRLDELGAALREIGVTLAYHNHDAEMRKSAREFHHMMLGTDEKYVKMCLDSHWVYRGSGDSTIALFDAVKLYAGRVVELHVRQSIDGVWREAFGPGDIDYSRVRDTVPKNVHVVLEQAVEAKSPKTMDALTAHKQGLTAVRKIFG